MTNSTNTIDILIKSLHERVSTLEQNGIPGVRDFFATSALSILANNKADNLYTNKTNAATWAYEMADAMMKERNKTLDS